jgi:ABC-type glycerol-3-phosphate transport system permease component
MALRKLFPYIVSFLVLAFAFTPLVFVAIGSFMPEAELRAAPGTRLWFARGPTTVYYQYIFLSPFGIDFPSNDPYVRYEIRSLVILNIAYFPRILLNSVTVASAVALINLIFGALAAYAFARLNFKAKTATFAFILVSRLLPPISLAVPYYILMQSLGLINQLSSVILVHSVLTLPFTIWYLTLYYRTIPVDMEEAAFVDGATLFQTLRYISFPTAGSGLVAIGLFSFLLSYNEFLFAQFLLGRIDVQTVPIFVASMSTATDVYWAMMYGILVLTTLPMIALIFIVFRFINITQLAGALRH